MNWRLGPTRGMTIGVVALLVGLWVGCVKPEETTRLNPPSALEAPGWAGTFTYHNDQGMLSDRNIADIHFLAGSADLSGTGVARLERYAELLATTGGTLTYTPVIADEALIKARLEVAEVFLAQVVPSSQVIEVVTGLPGGRGMTFAEAAGGAEVARQAEERGTAYNLSIPSD